VGEKCWKFKGWNSVLRLEPSWTQGFPAVETLGWARLTKSRFFRPPKAFKTYRAPFAGNAELEPRLHRHIRLENAVLIPQALEISYALGKRLSRRLWPLLEREDSLAFQAICCAPAALGLATGGFVTIYTK
jgi:hypothetical protein